MTTQKVQSLESATPVPRVNPRGIHGYIIGLLVGLMFIGSIALAYLLGYNQALTRVSGIVSGKDPAFQKQAPAVSPTMDTDEPILPSVKPDDSLLPPEPTPEVSPDASVKADPNELIEVRWNDALVPFVKEGEIKTSVSERMLYEVGEIATGTYAGGKLILEVEQGMGYGFYYNVSFEPSMIRLEDARLKGIDDAPEEITFPNTTYRLKSRGRGMLFSDVKIEKKLFSDPVIGDVYLAQKGCFMAELPDHTAIGYQLIIPFANQENGFIDLTFNDGAKNKDQYEYEGFGTCGWSCFPLSFIDEKALKPTERLVVAGKTSTGEDMYGIMEADDPELKELYNDKYTVAYVSDPQEPSSDWEKRKSKYTYDEFLGYHPLLYWKDPLGRWIEFKNLRFISAAEMCKPVLYLYPEKTMRLKVEVHPNGGFSYTNPPYKNGWEVIAKPNGKITDTRTGTEYEYLIWEGIGMRYPRHESGWVVADSEIQTFFDTTLPKLGLNEKESQDFKSYWLPRLAAHPYYHIHFLQKEEIDSLAPLAFSIRKPDTLIRVLMTARGLQGPQEAPLQILDGRGDRAGFTVVEWGGALIK